MHQLVRDHFETFRAQAAHLRDGQGLPRFVEQEFRDFLTCGCLAAGFARFRCPDCRLDRLVPRAVVAVYLRAVLGWLRHQATRRGVMDGRGGAVVVVQRFGAVNVHIHALVLDGVFAPDGGGGVSFHAHERHDDDVGPLLATIERRIAALLRRRGVLDDREGFEAPDRWSEDGSGGRVCSGCGRARCTRRCAGASLGRHH